jgi:predicted CopG family antitoxin
MIVKLKILRSLAEVLTSAKYESDESALSHADKIVEVFFHGARDEEHFQRKLLESTKEKSSTNRKRIVGYHVMGGTPLGFTLSRKERKYFAWSFCERMGSSATKIGWHLAKNRHDYHFVLLNQKAEIGGAVRGHDDPGMRRKTIAISDSIYEELNLMRRKNREAIIPTIADVRKRIAKDRNREQLAELIARRAREAHSMEWPLFFMRIRHWIVEAGHSIDESRSQGAELSIRYAGTQKNRRHIWKKLESEVTSLLKREERPMYIDQNQELKKGDPFI